MKKFEDLPYRPCVGLAVFNAQGKVFVGRRLGGPEHVDNEHEWQMPQGGIDDGEAPYEAALRELYEETSIRSIRRLGETEGWLKYDIPRDIAGEAWKGKYRGQKQKWYALRFTGHENEINITTPGGGGHKPEFAEWRWDTLANTPDLIVPFKRGVYEDVVRAFGEFSRE
ncbi:MAG: RNA pyrophosphohydrolase [Rhizobiales bacterium]|jgi:putative (di)nucleoside polyphosphate hydrolase|nr:RNA pyrophosphohydrolase [Hyphomicrobiales bacterium]